MKKSLSLSFIVVSIISILIAITGCATIATGTSELVTINCNVNGASIYLDGLKVGETPFTGEIEKNGKVLKIEKEGYKPYSISLSTSMEGAFWGNIICGGTLGSITDFATGAAYSYSPASYQVELIAKDEEVSFFESRVELRKFAMLNMSNIAIDLSNNEGPYLASLIELARLSNTDDNVYKIENLFKLSKGDQILFGKLIVDLFNS